LVVLTGLVEQLRLRLVILKMLVVLVGKTTRPQREQSFVAAVAVERRGHLGLVRLAVQVTTLVLERGPVGVAAVLMVEHLLLALREPQHLAVLAAMERQALALALVELQLP
jgi:hypothetical protein